ncbi:unnamed protein product [Rotaria sp. Silwood1]|nr:unnamed protein product [Rotaria sp. Silwood1]
MASNIETVVYEYFNTENGQFWEQNGNEVKVDLYEFMYRLVLRLNSINFISPRVYKNHVNELIKLYNQLDAEKILLNPILTNLKRWFSFKNEMEIVWDQWLQLLMPEIERCLEMMKNNIEPSDMDIAYELVKYSKEELEKRGQPFSPRLVAFLAYSSLFPAQVNTYTVAASMILEWIRHEHGDIGQGIKEEIDRLPPIGELTIEYLNSMEFTQACIHEVIRMRTDSQLSMRYAAEDIPLSNEKYIPNGNLVANPMTRAQDLFLNPEKFDPERHLPPREENKADLYRVLPFGRAFQELYSNLSFGKAIAPARVQTQQPQAYFRPINNSFNLLPSEKVYREWEYHDNLCCCNNAYYTALTDIRLLTRYEENICSENCSEPSHTDSAIFLRDIDQMRECRGEQPTFFFLLWITLICAWPCYVIRRVFCPKPKSLEIFGSFGSEIVRVKREDMPVAQVDLSTAVINSKLVGRS